MEHISVLYTCDNKFLPQTAVSIASVIENNKDSLITFYIATETENNEDFLKLKNFYKDNNKICIKYINTKQYDQFLEEHNFNKWGSKSFYAYWRLFAFDLLEEENVWYLDSDILCLNKIEKPNLNNKVLGACLDSAHADFNKIAHIDTNYYFYNTGVLYVDINKWKNNNVTRKILLYLKTTKYKPLMCTQDIISIVLQDEIELLNPKYNYLVGYDYYGVNNSFKMYSLNKKPFYSIEEIINSRKNAIFYHCLGGVFGRPWQEGNNSPIKNEYNKYQNLSCWKEYKTSFNPSTLFKIEKKMEFLPKPIYNLIHNVAQKIYLKKMQKNSL